MFQAAMFSAGLAASISYLITNNSKELRAFWIAFKQLSPETQFCLAIIVIATTFFGGAMYIAPVESSDNSTCKTGADRYLMTPASCDTIVGFDIPSNLAQDDKVFFENFLTKYQYALNCHVVFTLTVFYPKNISEFPKKLSQIFRPLMSCQMRPLRGLTK